MRQMDKNSGRHRLAADATLPDRRNMLIPPASRVMLPASSIPRTTAWRVNRLACSVWRHSCF